MDTKQWLKLYFNLSVLFTPRMATSSDSLYNLLIGQTFTGEYMGLKPKDAGQRAVFKIDKCGNDQLIGLFDHIRQSVQGEVSRVIPNGGEPGHMQV